QYSSSQDQANDANDDDKQVEVAPGGTARNHADPGADHRERNDQPIEDAQEGNEGDDDTDQRDEADDQRCDVEHAPVPSIIPAAAAAAAPALARSHRAPGRSRWRRRRSCALA